MTHDAGLRNVKKVGQLELVKQGWEQDKVDEAAFKDAVLHGKTAQDVEPYGVCGSFLPTLECVDRLLFLARPNRLYAASGASGASNSKGWTDEYTSELVRLARTGRCSRVVLPVHLPDDAMAALQAEGVRFTTIKPQSVDELFY